MRNLLLLAITGVLLTGCVVEPAYYGHHRHRSEYNVVVREESPRYHHHYNEGWSRWR